MLRSYHVAEMAIFEYYE